MTRTNFIFGISRFFSAQERVILLSFLLAILCGTFLLTLPFTNAKEPLNIIDALFTATSATCVTGLIVVDTGSHFTIWGQLVILALIQMGGLGVMVFSTTVLYMLEGKLSIANRDMLAEILNQGPIQNLLGLVKTALLATVLIESIGAIFLFWRFSQNMPPDQALYFGIFHAISAFCNAGFALYADSLVQYQSDWIVNFTVNILIILGGLGFVVLYELHQFFQKKQRTLSYHSRLVLKTSAYLILSGALFFFFLENQNSLKNYSFFDKILISLFQSITVRTAGFNTIDFASLTNPTAFVLILYMFIGASPASTGGGIKTTTFAIIFAFIRARFSNKEEATLLYRRISQETLSKAITVTFFSGGCVVLFTLLLLMTESAGVSYHESRDLFLEILFEVTSAFATVGVSLGITAQLSEIGRFLLVVLMFIGRLGPLTVMMAVSRKEKIRYHYATAEALVG